MRSTIVSPSPLPCALVVKPGTNTVIGYVLAHEDDKGQRMPGDGAQLQRWHLFEPTDNRFEVRPPPGEWAGLSLEDWRSKVAEAWKPGHLYILARVRIYVYGGTYGDLEWIELPTSKDLLPFVQYPDEKPGHYQIDVTGGRVLGVRQREIEGIAQAFATKDPATTIEFWCTHSSYSPAGRSTSAAMEPNGQTAAGIDDFLRIAAATWGRGSALSIVGCLSYQGVTSPEPPSKTA